MSYRNTFIRLSPDCPERVAIEPPLRKRQQVPWADRVQRLYVQTERTRALADEFGILKHAPFTRP